MLSPLLSLIAFLEHTWQSLAYQQWAIATVLAILALAPFAYLARPTSQRAGSPGVLTIGIIISLAGFVMVVRFSDMEQKRIAQINEGNALGILENIYQSELQFKARKGRFGTIAELVNEGMEGRLLLDGEVIRGYRFVMTALTDQKFCLHANRAENTSGFRDCNITETGDIRCIKADQKGTVPRGQGTDPFADAH